MTFEEFMKLETGDGVVFDNHTCTVLKVTDIISDDLMDRNYITVRALVPTREVVVACYNRRNCKMETYYLTIHTSRPNDVHNRCMLERLQVWDPFVAPE